MVGTIDSPDGHATESVERIRTHLPELLRDLVDVVRLYPTFTDAWHCSGEQPDEAASQVRTLAMGLHMTNLWQWQAEDRVRRPDASDTFIAEGKRRIDRLNQQRHNQIEQLDILLFVYLYEQQGLSPLETELHSETPANLLDRLSILSLKVYHMVREAERRDASTAHRSACRHRLGLLQEQSDDMYGCLCRLCLDLCTGRKRFKVYRQFKMYNDPELNPEIYRYRPMPNDTGLT